MEFSLIYAAAKQCQVGNATPGPVVGRHGASLSEQQMQIVLALPGIGPVTARAVCARFHSLHELLPLMPPHWQRSPVSRQREPRPWNSCCAPPCPPQTIAAREKHE